MSDSMVYVCPTRDIECGDRAGNWCATCPKRVDQPQPAEPVAGWRMVPADPTDAMVDATHHGQPVADIYRDMIAAAPPAPQRAGRVLTDEQALAIIRDTPHEDVTREGWIRRQRLAWVRAIERAHGIGEGGDGR